MTASWFTVIDSALGPLTLVAGPEGLSGVYMLDHKPAPNTELFGQRDDAALAPAITQIHEFLAGTRASFELELAPAGTDFQLRVWQALRTIPYGETRSYGWIAEAIGQPSAVRAVGLANSKNPLSLVVPCHRVVGASGALTGYAGGIERKRWLLDLESGARLDFVA